MKRKNKNLINTYRKIYSIDKLDISEMSDVSFLIANGDKYLLSDNKLLINLDDFDSNNMLDYLHSIEKKHNIKIIAFYPICFTKENNLIIACKVENLKNNYKEMTNELTNINMSYDKYYDKEFIDEFNILKKYHLRYSFYRRFIKKYILTSKLRKKEEFLSFLKYNLGKYDSIIDVSCGDNEDIFKISNKCNLVVGNDINISEIDKLSKKYPNYVFTNHNMMKLPFKNKLFDIAYCKNTFHHLDGKKEIIKSIESMKRISKKCIIIDIEDPSKIGGLPKFLNKYLYKIYLKDNCKEYLDYDSFKKLISEACPKNTVTFKKFKNILGNYMVAIIERG